MFLLLALLVGATGSCIVFLSKTEQTSKVLAFTILTFCYTLIGWWGFYAGLPSIAWPLFGWLGGLIIIWWVISAIVCGAMENEFPISAIIPGLGIFVLLIVCTTGSSCFNASNYAGMIGSIKDKTEKHWAQDIQPIDPTRIRLVPSEVAISMARTNLSSNGSTLGSQFPLSTEYTTLQKIKNDFYYLIPMDYKGFTVWTNAKISGVPGYVKVSATDPYAKPILVMNKKMKYTPGAWFGDNMQRRLWTKYYNKVLKDFTFEEDDSGNVYWTITVCKPTVSYFGLVVEGIILFDPETGKDEYVSKDAIEKDPKYYWVDRVMPQELIQQYIDWWGEYKNGWWNSCWTHINLLIGETPSINYSSNGRCVYVSPITSNNSKDQAMTGLMYADARTGEFTYYTTSGGATEAAIINAVNSVVKYKYYQGSSQIVYENIYGKLTALVPVISTSDSEHIHCNYQGLALVELQNKRVAFATTPQEALSSFQMLVMNSGGQITTENRKDVVDYSGKILRLGWDMSTNGKQYYIYLNGFKNSFTVSSSVQSEIMLTKEGDLVHIQYIKSDQASVPTMYFHNVTLNLQGSKNEQSVLAQMDTKKVENESKDNVADFRDKIKDMSDEDLKKLLKK
jgi:hypothetical protein